MRSLSSAQGKGHRRRHYVPDGQHSALCGFMPSWNCGWRQAKKNARTCIDCHRLKDVRTITVIKGISYAETQSH